jgi:adenine phosphoribosyltransferase
MPLKSLIRTIPHYPKHGVMFRDITTLLRDGDGFNATISQFVDRYRDREIGTVAGIEARGFIIGAAIASQLGTGFVPIRKTNKLPGERIGQEYSLEYGVDRLELHIDAISPGQRVLLVDDLIATGGTAEASIKLIEQVEGKVVEACFVIDLPELGGRRRIEAMGHSVFSLCEFEGE